MHDRRTFLFDSLMILSASSMLSAPAWAKAVLIDDEPVTDYVRILRERNWPTLVAYIETQLDTLGRGKHIDRPEDVARDFIAYIECLDPNYQRAISAAITWVNAYCINRTGRRLYEMDFRARRSILNQGEEPGAAPAIRWEEDFLLHLAITTTTMLSRMVIFSRTPAINAIDMHWSIQCRNPLRLADVSAPAYPDIGQEYDLCIIGTGAGGATVAAHAAERGLRVLLLEDGNWVNPGEMSRTVKDADGAVMAMPPRGDESLMKTYKGAGVNLADNVSEQVGSLLDMLSPEKRKAIKPVQAINIIQARVVGGGPFINNAIHLEMTEDTWDTWEGARPEGITFAEFRERMLRVKADLGVNVDATKAAAGPRSLAFVKGCMNSKIPVEPLPVSIIPNGLACGADNSVDPFGEHIGGVHPYRPGKPNSYLMRALNAAVPAQVAYNMRAIKINFSNTDGQLRVGSILVEDRRGLKARELGHYRIIKAKQYVLAAGVGASTKLLYDSGRAQNISFKNLGKNLTGNVFTPVYAVFDKPLVDANTAIEPGITQSYYVKLETRKGDDGKEVKEAALENWFHFPSTVALGLTGWFNEWARVMQKFNHIAICGMVVPTKPRPENYVDAEGKLRLKLDAEEFELILGGLEKIGRIYFAAATPDNKVTLHLPTKAVLLDHDGRPVEIRDAKKLKWAMDEIRKRGPAFLNLATSHPQGGNALGSVVDASTFQVIADGVGNFENFYLMDASIFPKSCGVNPQLTIKSLASMASEKIIENHSKD